MALYVTQEEGRKLSFNYSYKQTFLHDPRRNHGMPEYVVVSDFMKCNDTVRQAGLEILLYLRKFCFASRDMLLTMLQLKGLDTGLLDGLLEDYTDRYLLNYFTISQYDMGEVPDDAFRVYCLDSSAIFVLTHFSTTDSVSWLSSDNVRSIELVTKYLATGMFYQQLASGHANTLKEYSPLFDASIGKRMMRFSAKITVMNGFTPIHYLLDTVRDYDLPGPWTKRCSEQLSVFIQNNHWQRYYDTEPNYLLLCENVEQGREAAEIFCRLTQNKDFRIVTDEVLSAGLKGGALYRYDETTKQLVQDTEHFLQK